MLQPSNDCTHPAFIDAERPVATDPAAVASSQSDSLPSARTEEDGRISPICAAYWAY